MLAGRVCNVYMYVYTNYVPYPDTGYPIRVIRNSSRKIRQWFRMQFKAVHKKATLLAFQSKSSTNVLQRSLATEQRFAIWQLK